MAGGSGKAYDAHFPPHLLVGDLKFTKLPQLPRNQELVFGSSMAMLEAFYCVEDIAMSTIAFN